MVYGLARCGAWAAGALAGAAGFAGGLAARPPARSSAAGRANENERKDIFIRDLLGRFAKSSHNQETAPVPVRRKRVRRLSPSPTAGTGTGDACAFEGKRAQSP